MICLLDCFSSCLLENLCSICLACWSILGGRIPMYISCCLVWFALLVFFGGCGISPCRYVMCAGCELMDSSVFSCVWFEFGKCSCRSSRSMCVCSVCLVHLLVFLFLVC